MRVSVDEKVLRDEEKDEKEEMKKKKKRKLGGIKTMPFILGIFFFLLHFYFVSSLLSL